MKIIFAFIVVAAIALTTTRKHSSQNEMAAKHTEPSESKEVQKAEASLPRIMFILNDDTSLPSRSRSLWWSYNVQKGC